MNEDSPGEPGTLPGMHKCTTVFSFRSPPPLLSYGMNLINFSSAALYYPSSKIQRRFWNSGNDPPIASNLES
jgi:hypothetical protein